MNDPRLPRLVYFLMLALGLWQWARAYGELPPTMAAHFAANGAPNGFQSKELFFVLMLLIVSVSAVVSFVAPRSIASKAPERLNLPNKAYWLAPERRPETFRYFAAQFGWFGCAILFVLLYGTSLAINANFHADRRFDSVSMSYVMILFAIFTLLWAIMLVRHFRNIPPCVGNPQP